MLAPEVHVDITVHYSYTLPIESERESESKSESEVLEDPLAQIHFEKPYTTTGNEYSINSSLHFLVLYFCMLIRVHFT